MAFSTQHSKAHHQELSQPVGQAIDALSVSLRDLQAMSKNGAIDLHAAAAGIFEAIAFLVEIRGTDSKSFSMAASVNAAMNHLRDALSGLQSVAVESPGIDDAARTVAKSLALLYPLSKIGASKVPVHPTASRDPVPAHILDRRQAQRTAVEAEVGFQSDTNFFMGFSEDVSTGGLFISTYDTRELGSVMNLNFTLPGGHLISVDGVVRWVREYNETTPDISPGMGVQFENLRNDDKEAIEEFINERPAMFYDDE